MVEETQQGQLTGQQGQTNHMGVPYHMTSHPVYKTEEVSQERQIITQGWFGCWSAGGEQLHYASYVSSWVLFIILFAIFLFIIIIIYFTY